MSVYVVDVEKMQNGTKDVIVPDRTKLKKVKFHSSVTLSARKKSRKRVMIIALSTVFCVILIPLCTWIVFTFYFSGVYSGSIPEWQQDNFTIESIPGLRYHPKFPGINQVDTLIFFTYDETRDNKHVHWTDVIESFLQPYKNPLRPQDTYLCDENDHPRDKVCNMNINSWYPCTSQDRYGYGYWRRQPCVFLRFNEILNWVPEYYNDTDSLPEDMPNFLKEHIIKLENDSRSLNNVWVSCEGLYPADMEHRGPIEYIPQPGFPGYFFPFNNTEGYLSPLVAVHFERPRTGVLISIECRLWAPNIEYDREKGRGLVQFELLMD